MTLYAGHDPSVMLNAKHILNSQLIHNLPFFLCIYMLVKYEDCKAINTYEF